MPSLKTNPAIRLACYSGLILFFELAFIRYTAAYVRVFSFYLNFVLIATFLGMGVGLLRAASARQLKWIAGPAPLLLLGAVAFFALSPIAVPQDPNEFVWGIFSDTGTGHQIPMLPVVAALFALCALFFIPLGALLGAEFRKLPPLKAYAFDIVGSLVGILSFALLSAFRQPPLVWFGIAFALWVLLSIDDWRFATVLAIAGVASLTLVNWTARDKPEFWSPYYRINVQKWPDSYQLNVNGSLHQYLLDFSPASVERFSGTKLVMAAYERPYAYAAHLDTVLIVGAGTGNDIALLLASGVKYIDAVEIDPVIAEIGRELHFQKPYADPRVHLHVDDARAFLRKTQQHYDVIVFGTLDSQTLLSGMSSVRLDNYVYTVESFQSARARLKPDGTLIAYHRSGLPYIAGKIYQMLDEAFGAPPGVFAEEDRLFNFTFIAGHGASAVPPLPAEVLAAIRAPYARPHDNWPYLYLKSRTIPAHYIVALLSVLLVTTAFVGIGGSGISGGGIDATMFFMGAGFLLVETKSVTEMSLLFGSTWTVNVLVFTSILIMVLLANLLVLKRSPMRMAPLFAWLFAFLGVAYLVPASGLLWLGPVGQWILGGLMVGLPVFFASLIFSTLLRDRQDATRALAFNLLGAIVGGVLEYSSMALGIKALYLLAAAIYFAAWLSNRRSTPLPS